MNRSMHVWEGHQIGERLWHAGFELRKSRQPARANNNFDLGRQILADTQWPRGSSCGVLRHQHGGATELAVAQIR